MRKRKSGLFVTFEGTEGAGKSTLIREVGAQLQGLGFSSFQTREPGGSPVAEKIREVTLSQEMDRWTELFLYVASRAEHIAKSIRPELAKGKIVLCDRFTDSSLAYQGAARGIPWKEIRKLNKIATQDTVPELTFWIDIDPAKGLARASDRNRFEDEGLKFQKKVRAGFARIRREEPRRFVRINPGSRTPQEIAQEVVQKITKKV